MTEHTSMAYKAWDLPLRLFHWINFLCVVTLSFLGLIMLNKGAIGISAVEAGIGLKTLHVLVGYVFVTNLVVRIIWGFIGSKYSRWSSLLPGKNFSQELKSYQASIKTKQPQTFIGHNPKGRISVMVVLAMLVIMTVTGLVRAGTDIYYPPLGGVFASQVAADGVSPSEIKPYDKTGTHAGKLAQLQSFKKPVGVIHVYTAYALWLLILLHIVVVIRAESTGEGTLISAMFSGKKYLPREPADP